ncbi:MAG: alkane 1-monooxygenase [Gemmatimonadetes bacterium]|nr:alkane 1-monooxygenase [Gemmatimonadota bacterium]MDA1102448.1 alkane 1-monooxygenase [Gemmatimonadota bacterium]
MNRNSPSHPEPNQAERPEAWSWHLLGLISPLLVLSTNLLGGAWVVTGVLYMLVLGPALDVTLGKAERPRPPHESGRPFEALLYVHALVQFIALGTLLYRASLDGNAWTTWVAAASTGLSSGVSGIIVAHELGHTRPRSISWWVGRVNLLSVLYLHFTTEHNHTHHRLVATSADPASARDGESLWHFVARTVPGQFIDAVRVHSAKDQRGANNPVLRGMGLQVLLVAGMYALAGLWVTVAFVSQAAFAVFLLEYINYIRHYGLTRQLGERQTEQHSWQSEERWSRWTLLELTRHPAHHMRASEPFWRLQPYDDVPTLPSGYYGCFWIAVFPPLWRRVMRGRWTKA